MSNSNKNSVVAMLESHGDPLVSTPSNTSSSPRSATATSLSSFILSQALGESLPRILLVIEKHSTMTASASAASLLAGNVTPASTSSNTLSTLSHMSSRPSHSSGNILSVPSSICNPSVVGEPSLCGTGGATNRPLAISDRHGSSLPLLGSPSQVILLFVQCQH